METSSAQMSSYVTVLTDVMEGIDVKVSSRAAMVTSLTDGSTETFWESGDEDRGKMKFITMQLLPNAAIGPPRIVCIYIDNGRDVAVYFNHSLSV
jgi:E3 ubiquitin-protein ligase MYCBP2